MSSIIPFLCGDNRRDIIKQFQKSIQPQIKIDKDIHICPKQFLIIDPRQHYLDNFPICSFSLNRKMNQKDQGCTQFFKTNTPFPKRKILVPKKRKTDNCFFTQIVISQKKRLQRNDVNTLWK